MARPFSGKTHTGERRERRPNGDIYVYERVTRYDRDARRTVTVSERLKGKIVAGSDALVPTRPRKSPVRTSGSEAFTAERRRVGMTDILAWAGKASGIDDDVRGAFPEGDALKILSLARYLAGTDGGALPRIEGWQMTHELPYPHPISEDVYGDLFAAVGLDEGSVQRYFRARARRLGRNPLIAYDSTTVSTYSVNQPEARHGFNKDGDGLPTIKLLTLYSVADRQPIAFAKQPGNVPDVIAVSNALTQLEALTEEKPTVVTDNGYCSEANMLEFTDRNIKFLTLAGTHYAWIRKIVDEEREALGRMSSVCPFDSGVSGVTRMVMHKFILERKRARNEVEAGSGVPVERRLYVHVFHSAARAADEELRLREELLLLKKQIEAGVELKDGAKRRAEELLVVTRSGVSFNEEAVAKRKRYFGFFAMVGNERTETFEALSRYRSREKVEEMFADYKGRADGRRPRVWGPDRLRGRQLVQFVALGYYSFLLKSVNDLKSRLGTGNDGKTAGEVEMEKKLKSWLDGRSIAQILDWFDCVEQTTVSSEMTKWRWRTESVARDRLLLRELGVVAR